MTPDVPGDEPPDLTTEAADTAPTPPEAPSFETTPVRVDRVRGENFRGVGEFSLELHPKLTVLVGRNNCGKSRVLRATALAVGSVAAEKDDLTVGATANAVIDIWIAPANPDGAGTFDQRLAATLTGGARQTISEQPLQERVGWRTTISRSAEGLAAVTSRSLLRWDEPQGRWEQTNLPVSRELLRLVRGDLVQTHRDLASELRQRGSAAYRLIDDLELKPELIEDLQTQLDELSAAVVSGSGTLQGIKSALQELSTRVDAIGTPTVMPVPGRVNDLSAVATIEMTDSHGHQLPLRLHGTGARSLASLRLQGVLYERRLGADGGDLRPHALTLIEEPEAHLHPQAQFDLKYLLMSIPGQVVTSTHSTHLVSELDHEQLAILAPTTSGIGVTTLRPVADPDHGTPRQLRPQLYASEMEKLRRGVERPFGEILFASLIVLGDGATERAFLPDVLRHALGTDAHGLCVVDPGSMNDPAAVASLKAARLLGIPWFVLADSDADGHAAVQVLLNNLAPPAEHAQLRAGHIVEVGGGSAIEQMLVSFDSAMCANAASRTKPGIDVTTPVNALKLLKGSAGRYLAEELITTYPVVATWPAPLVALVAAIQAKLQNPPPAAPGA